jgi:predicted nucleic acid-binding Zn ribbon protein
VRQNFSDPLLTLHNGCGGEVERLISAPALQFKGSGWYITDYARGGAAGPKSESKTETSKSESESKSEKKSESKSETKTETKTESKSESKPAPVKSSSE